MTLINAVPFTRFTAPNGRQSPDSIFVDDDTYAAWKKVQAVGFRMTVEILQTGHISMCIEIPALGDYDCVVCANSPDVLVKLAEMLLRFDTSKVPEWIKEMSE